MIIPDINLLVYAYNPNAPLHAAAKAWWEDRLNGHDPVGLPWLVAAGFIRVMTHPRVLARPMPVEAAIAAVEAWYAAAPVLVVHPGERFPALLFGYLRRLGVAANLTTDAQLAALAVEHQAVVCTNDADFSRFEGLRTKNPLIPAS